MQRQLTNIREKIERACQRSGRDPHDVTLIAVCKHQPIEKILEYIDLCRAHRIPVCLAENYIQEALEKIPQLLPKLQAQDQFHLIGHLQSNKAKPAVQLFNCIQTVDSKKLARELNKYAQQLSKKLEIFLQVNISDDQAKFGCSVEESRSLCAEIIEQFPHITITGLMTIPKLYDEPSQARADFQALKKLKDTLEQAYIKNANLSLSMGMSADYEIAIEEGATMVRIGTALFGERI